jgi:hypothetical protein
MPSRRNKLQHPVNPFKTTDNCQDLKIWKFIFVIEHQISGGERGVRTLDTLPYTHFPGVRLRPLGHLSGIAVTACL